MPSRTSVSVNPIRPWPGVRPRHQLIRRGGDAVLVIVGIWTRLAALVIAFDMVMAVVLVLRDKAFAINPE